MYLQAQSSRLTSLLIKLRNQQQINSETYQQCATLTIHDNKEIFALFQKFENGMSDQEFIRGISLMLNQSETKTTELYFECISSITQNIKRDIKISYKELENQLTEIFRVSFNIGTTTKDLSQLTSVILEQFNIATFALQYLNQQDEWTYLSNIFDMTSSKQSEYSINNILADTLLESQKVDLFYQSDVPKYLIRSSQQNCILFVNYINNTPIEYKEYFQQVKLHESVIKIIKFILQMQDQKQLLLIRSQLLNVLSYTIEQLIFIVIFRIIKIIQQNQQIKSLFFEELDQINLETYLQLIMKQDLKIIKFKIKSLSSELVIQKIQSLFLKSLKQYKRKLASKEETIDSFQKISQFNEGVLSLFFNQYLQIYYMTTQWNHYQFMQIISYIISDKYYLSESINFQDPVYNIFQNNSQIIQNIQILMESEDNHFEYNDGLSKYSLKVYRGVNRKVKNLSVFLFNITVRRPTKDLIKIFRQKVRLLQTLTKATQAFRSKQLVMNNQFFRNSALVMYLPDYDLKKIMTENETHFMTSSLEKYKNHSLIQEQKKVGKFNNKYQSLSAYKPEDAQLQQDETLQKELIKYDFNLLDSVQDKVLIVYNLLNMCDYFKDMAFPLPEFCNFITIMKHQYNKRQNSFHNFIHGINVMHGCYFFAYHPFFSQYFNELQKFTLVFSGLCHDVNHTGTTNLFEVNACTKLAIKYNDRSVLENHHIANTYKILSHKECNILINVSQSEKSIIRKFFISNILATDNQQHFNVLNNVEIKISQLNKDPKIFDIEENKLLLSGFLTHAADFFGAIKTYNVARIWSEKLRKEFQAQSALEEIMGITQTPYLKNLDNEYQFAKNEAGFMKVIVKPIYDTLNKFSNGQLPEQVMNLTLSIQKYEEIAESEQKSEQQK